MTSSFVRLNIKLKILFFLFLAFSFQNNYAQIYQHDFGTTTINSHPYTDAPTTINSYLSNSSWTNTTSSWSDGNGNSGRAIRLTCVPFPATTTISLTFNVATNYQVSISSFDFWRVRSPTGATNWTMKINGINAGTGTITTTGTAIGVTPVTNPIAGLTGSVTVQLILSGASGAGTFRLDDFILNGTVTTTCVQPAIASFFPILGPRNTVVEITGNGFQAGTGTSSVKFNGFEATSFNVISNTLLEAVVPTNATTGLISITTNNCTGLSTVPFTIISSSANNTYSSDIYISEIYDAETGTGGIIEIYNGTASPKNLDNYDLERYLDIGDATPDYTVALTGTLQPGGIYLLGIGSVPCGITPDLDYLTGFNDNDKFKLLYNSNVIDEVRAPNEKGYTIRRLPTAIAPKTVFVGADWDINSNESCADIDNVTLPITTIPIASVNPLKRTICENTSTTFTTTLNAGLTYTYQWKVLTAANTWVNVVDNANYSGAASYILTINNAPASFNKNQYYCEVNSSSFKIISNAVQLLVSPLVTPTFSQVNAICPGATLSALPITSTEGIAGTWSPALNNLATTLYTFTPTAGQCASNATMTITVNSNNTPTFTQVTAICPGATLSALPTNSIEGISGTWSPALNNLTTTLYTFTPTAGQCASNATMTITVSSNITPTFTQVTAICPGATLLALPTTSTEGIAGTWSPALNNLVTTLYTFTPTAGQCTSNAIMTITVNSNSTPTFTQVNAICPGATLSALPTTSTNGIAGTWAPALNTLATTLYTFTPTAGQCATNATMTITVNSNSTPTFTQITAICAGAPLSALPTTSTEGIAGTWSPVLNNLATTLYTFTPTAGQCASNATMTITVNSNSTPTFVQVTAICPGAVLSPLPTTSTEGIAGTWSPALNNMATTLYTFTPTAGQCASNATMTIAVNSNSTPTFTQVNTICPGATLLALPTTSIDGIAGTWSPTLNNMATTLYTFTPTAGQCATNATMTITVSSLPKEPKITITQPSCANPFGIIKIIPPFDPSYSYSIDNINYQSTPIFENLNQGSYDVTARNYYGCTSTVNIAIINNAPIVPVAPTLISTDPTCLNSRGSIEVTAPLGTGFSYSINGINFQSATTFNNLDSDDYNLYVKNLDGCISNPTPITINMVPQPISTRESYYYCVDKNNVTLSPAKIDTGLSPLDYSFYWTFNGNPIANTTKELDASQEGVYRVEATNLITGCEIHLTATVKKSSPATATATVGIDFEYVQTITVNITSGISEYLYQLNEGPFQESNVFNIYLGGIYTITVMDKNGCNDFVFKVEAYNFPRFFTPNGDGYNDFWNITEIPNPAKSTILIFDRMGKLLKQISPTGEGWDGTFLGKPMPATDYWFVLKYEDVNGSQKEFKSHFALKR